MVELQSSYKWYKEVGEKGKRLIQPRAAATFVYFLAALSPSPLTGWFQKAKRCDMVMLGCHGQTLWIGIFRHRHVMLVPILLSATALSRIAGLWTQFWLDCCVSEEPKRSRQKQLSSRYCAVQDYERMPTVRTLDWTKCGSWQLGVVARHAWRH